MPNQFTTMYDPICTVDGCDKAHKSRGYCSGHYTKFVERSNDVERIPGYGRPPKMFPGYHAMHHRVYKEFSADACAVCPSTEKVEFAWTAELCHNRITETQGVHAGRTYCLHAEHYLPLCTVHHKLMDGVGGNHDREHLGLPGLFNEVAISEIPGEVIA